MPYPTASEICDQVRAILADQDVAGGNIYTNAKLLPNVQRASRDVWRALVNIQAPLIVRMRYAIVRANTVSLDISGAVGSMATLLPGLREPLEIRDRASLTEYTITAATQSATGVLLTTSAAHARATGDRVTVGGLLNSTGDAMGGDGMYGIAVVNTTQFTALGMHMRTGGTFATTGQVVYSANGFAQMDKVRRLDSDVASKSSFGKWAWTEDRLLFNGNDEDRQIRVIYAANAVAPEEEADIVAINDSLDCIAVLAAAYATSTRMPSISQRLMVDALGPSLQRNGSAGMLRDLILPINNASQVDMDQQRQPIEFNAEWITI